VTAVLSLALGIGANAAMFSILDRLLLRTLPVSQPGELVFLYHPGPVQGSQSTEEAGSPSFSYPMFRGLQKEQTPFTGIAGTRTQAASLSYKGDASAGTALMVSGNYFSVLGVGPAIGRLLTDGDDPAPGAHPVVVLTYSYWERRFGANPAVLNETLVVNGQPMTIVGVSQKGFTGERPGSVPDLFMPITLRRELTADFVAYSDRQDYWVALMARLEPGVTLEQATTAINVAYRAELEQDAALLRSPSQDFLQRFKAKSIILKPGQYGRGSLREQGRTPMLLMQGMTLLVLLIACANVANLQLARAAARTREVAVRLAMGASRGQLLRQFLLESSTLALVGGLCGLVVSYWTLRGILSALPTQVAASGIVTTSLDPRVLVFCLVLSMLTGVAFGLYPALHASKADLVVALREQNGQTTSSRGAGLFRKALVTVQTAMSLLLLISAGLFAKTLVNLTSIDLGIRPDHLMTFSLAPTLNGYPEERITPLYKDLSERLVAVPGVTLVSAARVPAIANSSSSTTIRVEGYAPAQSGDLQSNVNSIGPAYFRTLGIPLVAGREFERTDEADAPRVAIVNEAFVRHYFQGQNPLGRRLGRGQSGDLDTTIVGIVKDAKYASMRAAPPRVFYRPYLQERPGSLYFYVRTAIQPEQIAPSIRREVAALDPNLPIRNMRTMEAQIDNNIANERLMAILTATFAGLATLLAAVGLYGVLAYNVARRTREIGIRMALGAHAPQVRRLVVREMALILGIGVVVGIGAAAAVGTLLRTVLYEMLPWDPGIYGGATALMALIAIAAAYLPARRASAVDPMVALRTE
jgi:predicted permease